MSSVLAPQYDIQKVSKDFPILAQEIHGKPLVYLDNAASTQKPASVIDAIANFYRNDYANVHEYPNGHTDNHPDADADAHMERELANNERRTINLRFFYSR